MNFVCEHCRNYDHDYQPVRCKGGTWCDCGHRPVREIYKEKEETK
jgi:hypothetical protein